MKENKIWRTRFPAGLGISYCIGTTTPYSPRNYLYYRLLNTVFDVRNNIDFLCLATISYETKR